MAIIYTYPVKTTPANNDLILISDSADNNKTKQVTVSSVKALTAGVTSIIAGSNITISPTSGLGDVTINSSGGGTPTQPGNPSASVQYNDGAGAFAGSANLTFATNTLTLTDTLDIKGDGTNPGTLKLYCEDTTTPHAVSILGPVHTGATPYSIRLPKEIATQTAYSSNGRILESDASGALQWIATPTSGGAVNQVTAGGVIPASSGAPLIVTPSTGNVVVTSARYVGGSNEGHVPLGGTNTTFLRGDGTWVTPSSSGGISFSGTTANGIATYSSASIANVSSNLTIDNTNKKLSIGSTYSIQDLSGAFNIGSLSSTQAQENIAFYINGSEKVRIDEDGRLVSSAGSAANPNLKLGAGNDGIYGTSNTVQIVTNGTSKISVSDGNAADIQMNDLVEFGYGLKFGAAGNTLSTYEEGTWTPTPYDSGGNPTTAVALGTYIRVGDLVNCYFYLNITSSGSTPGAAMVIQSLPYAGNNINGQRGGVIISRNDGTNYVQQQATSGLVEASNLRLKRILSASTTSTKLTDASWYASAALNYTLEGTVIYKIA